MKHKKITLISVILLIAILSSTTYAQDTDKTYTVGVMLWFLNESFFAEMADLGYVEGENINYIVPTFEGLDQSSPQEAFMEAYNRQMQEIVNAGVDAIFTNTDTDAIGVQALTHDIPIVFARSDDPVATGAVESLLNPGGNATGIITNRPHERRLQILTEIKPDTKKVYYLYSIMTLEAESVLQQVQAVAQELGVEIIPAPITDVASALEALENTPEDVDWLFLTPYVPFDIAFFAALAEVSIARQAGITGVTDLPIQGYLMGYGPNIDDTNRQGARILDRVLRGASPADLPVQTAENFLMINLEAAEALQMEIPVSILRQARTIARPGDFENVPTFFGE